MRLIFLSLLLIGCGHPKLSVEEVQESLTGDRILSGFRVLRLKSNRMKDFRILKQNYDGDHAVVEVAFEQILRGLRRDDPPRSKHRRIRASYTWKARWALEEAQILKSE